MVNTGERQNTITDSTYIFLEYQKLVLYFKTSSVVPYYTVLVVCCDIFILRIMKPCSKSFVYFVVSDRNRTILYSLLIINTGLFVNK